MLLQFTVCKLFQIFLGLMVFHTISCDCPFPGKNIPNGKITFTQPKDVTKIFARENDVLIFKCFRGYSRIGPRYIQCVDGEWTDDLPTCEKMECLSPPDIENAEYVIESENNEPVLGSSAIYSCNRGYELNNTDSSSLLCVLDKEGESVWHGELPVCKKRVTCPDPGVSKHGTRSGDCCFVGDTLDFSCNDNYELVGSKVILCLPTGIWSSGRSLCRPLQEDYCDFPPAIPHGLMVGEKDGDYFVPDEEVEILCEPGYTYKGMQELLLCEEGGNWEAEFGECTEIFCDSPEPLENGTILELLRTNLTSFPYDFEITYICDEGYRLIGGDSWRTCGRRGWSGKTPYCEAVQCPDPGIPEYGSRKGNYFGVGSSVRFSCFSGYDLLGSVERYCMPNGQWTGELSRCDISSNYCPNPGIPIKGSKNSTKYDMGVKVSFHCQPGYFQLGSEVRECLPDKTWSGVESKCLGPYDYDNEAQIRDILKEKLIEKAEEQEKELKRYQEELHSSWHNGSVPTGRLLDINFPGRIIMIFAFDVSTSVGRGNFNKSIEFAKAIVKKVDISEHGARAGALTFSSKAETQFLPLQLNTTEGVLEALDRIEYSGGGTSASSALSHINENFVDHIKTYFGVKDIKTSIFILTDGKANMGGDPKEEAENLKKTGVEIYGIGITGDVRVKSLYDIASIDKNANGKEHPNVFILKDYVTMSWLIQNMTTGTVDYSKCGRGLENVGDRLSRGKMNGEEQSKEEKEPWPWMAALYMTSGHEMPHRYKLKCGGSIIHRRFILTAAHCLYQRQNEGKRIWYEERDKRYINIKLGLTDIKNETYVQEYEITKMHIHPNYSSGNFYDYDIALLQIARPIEYTRFVRPICLVPRELPANSRLYSPDELAFAAGWGHKGKLTANSTQTIRASQKLKELLLPLQSRKTCEESLVDNRMNTSYFTDRMFCAGDGQGGNDICDGDSGGPLMQRQIDSEGYIYWTQIGIVSWGGKGCSLENTYGYYTHLQKLMPWVDDTIEKALKSSI